MKQKNKQMIWEIKNEAGKVIGWYGKNFNLKKKEKAEVKK